MTIKEKIKKANKCYVWVNACEEEGIYIQVSKSALLKQFKENPVYFDNDKFQLLGDNFHNSLTNLYVN